MVCITTVQGIAYYIICEVCEVQFRINHRNRCQAHLKQMHTHTPTVDGLKQAKRHNGQLTNEVKGKKVIALHQVRSIYL